LVSEQAIAGLQYMPTYDYLCDGCGHEFELFQSINEPVQRKCPECRKLKLRRLFGAGAAIVFKGSGFYQTDYRSDSYKKRAKADSDASSGKPDGAKGDSGGKKETGIDKKSTKPKKTSSD
jgi:putative FmdB family regulatory protein